MLDINIEFRKGIAFIRLAGILNKTTVGKMNDEVTDMIRDNGIRNVVFNISEIDYIDVKGINTLLYNYELCNQIMYCVIKYFQYDRNHKTLTTCLSHLNKASK